MFDGAWVEGGFAWVQQMESEFIIKKDIFLRVRTEPFEDLYYIHPKPIGKGAYGLVFKVREKLHPTDCWRAAKMYLKKNLGSKEQMLNELRILKRLDHPNIIKIYEVFENEAKIYVVQELCSYCEGGELFDRLHAKGGFSEVQTRRIFRQVLEGVNYCHSHRVCHRDVKPENVLFLKKDSLELKIVDFGLAFEWEQSMREELSLKSNKNVVGTAYYISPDILLDNNHYDERTDLWSLGVILYVLVSGVAPFDGETESDILNAVGHYKYAINVPEMKAVSPQLKDLIKRLLVPAQQRLSFEQIIQHPWMTSEPNRTPIRINTTGLNAFSKFSKTKRMVANFLACQTSPGEVQKLTRMFQQIDINHDGELSFDELRKGLEKEGMKYTQIKALMDSLDIDHNGKINYTEFLAGFSGEGLFTEQGIRRAFDMLDRDGNGVVEKKQLLTLFEQSGMGTYKGRAVESIVEECDKDGNGVIDYQEFKACLRMKL